MQLPRILPKGAAPQLSILDFRLRPPLVVLGRDPLEEDPATLITIPVERTMAGGRWVFEA
ncbi:MAG: hypothetical protein M3Q46_05015 [Verrucomicrobiota bacterium]|nr:hypothetical protein [Verrucomicrobiota bacterium]